MTQYEDSESMTCLSSFSIKYVDDDCRIADMKLHLNEATPTYDSSYCESYRSGGAAAGGIIGALCCLGCIGSCYYFFFMKKKDQGVFQAESKAPEPQP